MQAQERRRWLLAVIRAEAQRIAREAEDLSFEDLAWLRAQLFLLRQALLARRTK